MKKSIKMPVINITKKEYDVLNAIVNSQYNGDCQANYPVWTWDVSDMSYQGKTFSGIVSSLTEKGLVETMEEGKKDDHTILITEKGMKIFNLIKSKNSEIMKKVEKAPVAKKVAANKKQTPPAPEAEAPVKKAPVKKASTPKEDLKPIAGTGKIKAEKAPAKAKAEKAPAKAKKVKKSTRTAVACEVLKNLTKLTSIEDAAKRVDEGFVKGGGSSNVKQTVHLIKVLLPAAIAWGVVEQSNGKIKTC